jgi:IS5 family transposase
MTQLSFATLDHQHKKKRTKREVFLAEMEAVVPWALLLALIEPHYPKPGNGRRPYPFSVMLRIFFLQQWHQLSDPDTEKALYDIQSMRVRRSRTWPRCDPGRNDDPQFSTSSGAPRSN